MSTAPIANRLPALGALTRRSFALRLALALLLGVPATTLAGEPRHLVLLHTNDVHGQCQPLPAPWIDRTHPPLAGGLPRLAARIEQERTAAPGAMVVDAGDWFRGTPEGDIDHGLAVARIVASVGFDATCVGNHELDHGTPNLERILFATKLPAVLANARRRDGGAALRGTTPWRLIERAGLRVAFVGLLTTVTPDITHADARALEFEPPVVAWDRANAELRDRADLIVPLAHLSVDEARALARARPEIPLIIAAHDHARLERGVREGNTLIVENGARAASLGRVDLWLDLDAKRVVRSEARLIDLVGEADAALATAVATACGQLATHSSATLDQIIGTMAIACERGRHRLSAPQGSWICDALLRTSGAEVAIQNKGGTRTDFLPGPITRRQLFELLPFDNTVVSMALTGAEIEAIVRKGIEDTSHLGIDVGGMRVFVRPQGAGLFTLDHIEIGTERLDHGRRYRVVTSSYLAAGGDGYREFVAGIDRHEQPILMRELMADEVKRVGRVDPPLDPRIIPVVVGEN